MYFEIIGSITNVETINVESSIRELDRLREPFGNGRWRQLKGMATVQLDDGSICEAEVHWYEAQGIGKRKIKIKRFLE